LNGLSIVRCAAQCALHVRSLHGIGTNAGLLFPVAVRKDADPPEIIFDLGTLLAPMLGFVTFDFILQSMPANCSIAFAQRREDQRYSFVRRLALEMGPQPGDA
jgi:hypothetical protein